VPGHEPRATRYEPGAVRCYLDNAVFV
jgi:hypothetical protein